MECVKENLFTPPVLEQDESQDEVLLYDITQNIVVYLSKFLTSFYCYEEIKTVLILRLTHKVNVIEWMSISVKFLYLHLF